MAVLLLLGAALFGSAGAPGQLWVHAPECALDARRQRHFVYAVSNGTRGDLEVAVQVRQVCHERTGWWEAYDWSATWHPRGVAAPGKNPRLAVVPARSTVRLEILAPQVVRDLQGQLRYVKREGKLIQRARTIAARLHLPPRWLRGPESGLVELPQVGPNGLAQSAAQPGTETSAPRESPVPAQPGPPPEDTPGTILFSFRGAGLRNVLDAYAEIAEARLTIDPLARSLRVNFSVVATQALTRAAALRLLEQTLREQAGLVVKPSGRHELKVTLAERPATVPIRRGGR